jgi:hypothetical protein
LREADIRTQLGDRRIESQQDTKGYRLREADIRTQLGDRPIESQQDTQGYRLREADIVRHGPFYWRILKKTFTLPWFKNPHKKIRETRKLASFYE